MSSLFKSIIFRLKLVQVILSIASIMPFFFKSIITLSSLTDNIINLTLHTYLGIGIIVLASLCITIPVSEKVVLYSSLLAVVLHSLSTIFIIIDLFEDDTFWGLRVICALCTGANTVAFGWEVLYLMKFIHH